MSKRRILTPAIAIVVSLLVGYFVVSKLSWGELAALWPRVSPGYLALGLGTYFVANVLRARRFRVLTGERIGTMPLLRTVVIQNILNTFLPLRAGEASYLYMVHRTGAVKAGDNVGSLLGARVIDLLAALGLPLAALPLSRAWRAPGHPFVWFALVALGVATGFGIGLWCAEPLARVLERRALSSSGWLQRGLQLASDTLRALTQLRSGAQLGRVFALTLGCWLLVYVSGYFNLLGLGVSIGFWDAIFAYSFPVVASMTPLYMLGGFGVYEGSVGFGLNVVGVPLSAAMAAGLALHLTELLFVLAGAPIILLPSGKPRTTPDPARST